MNRAECQGLIDAYVDWLRRGLSVEEIDGACELTTPFLDRHNDHLQIYATRQHGKIVLTDDGYTIADLSLSGADVRSGRRKDLLLSTLNGFGIRLQDEELVAEASHTNLGQRMHSLIQAMLAVNDMFVLARPRVASIFWDDVEAFLNEHQVRYSSRVKLAGRSGFDHAIDFLIPKSPARPERFVHAIARPERGRITAYLFGIEDIREVRRDGFEAYAFLNDQDSEVGGDVLEALESYEVVPAVWSNREAFVEALVA